MKRLFSFIVPVLLMLAVVPLSGCQSWANHTSVLGVEVAWNNSGYSPSVRAGYINHDNTGLSDELIESGYMSFVWKKYYNVSLVSISGTTETISYTGKADSEFAIMLAKYIAVQTKYISKKPKEPDLGSGTIKTSPDKETIAKPKKETTAAAGIKD